MADLGKWDIWISIHALLAESDAAGNKAGAEAFKFLSTLSLRRATFDRDQQAGHRPDFYPRSPCGERPAIVSRLSMSCQFLSTLSLRRATLSYYFRKYLFLISIHALLAESDVQRGPRPHEWRHFYPRSPCGERPPRCRQHSRGRRFLSTLSLRRATPHAA